ncbi:MULTISPECIES: NAD(P)-binding protein [Aeromicrobium]|uniref:NAD(P)-binding protein n=1 Tax=Aeromicrobium TaxID=2040 RepID=UPI00257F0C6D|nr:MULTISPECIES: NAD(P)-binding protein [Aeromicrobium]
MSTQLDVDYLVVGAGAMGMAFTDALVDHADARVALVDRRHAAGGQWLEAYPFVRLHQASAFYGVASTLLGGGRLQESGPERGLQERATRNEICGYFESVLEALTESGRVEFLSGCEYAGDRTVVSLVSGERFSVPENCRIVDAHYLAPSIPAEQPPPFAVEDGAHVIAVNDLARLEEAPSEYVIAGAGKTATDACIWLLAHGVDPDRITWVRPRDPWLFDRAVIQPEPAIFLGMVADLMETAREAASPEDLFLRLEDAGIMLRIDRDVAPTMAKCPTLGRWELEELRTLEHVVRHGHLRSVGRGRLDFADASVQVAPDAVVVHCAADGLKYPPLVPIWGPDAITLQPIRAGFPCFGAALAGYVEATRDDDATKNRLCAPTPYGDSMRQWIAMTVLGGRSAAAATSEADVKTWSNGVALNPARIPEGYSSAALDDARERLAAHGVPGMQRLAQLV